MPAYWLQGGIKKPITACTVIGESRIDMRASERNFAQVSYQVVVLEEAIQLRAKRPVSRSSAGAQQGGHGAPAAG